MSPLDNFLRRLFPRLFPAPEPPATIPFRPRPQVVLPVAPDEATTVPISASGDPLAANLAPINRLRELRGLPPLAYSSALQKISFQNDVDQMVKGLGHWISSDGTSGQCAAKGVYSPDQAASCWRDSAPHYALITSSLYHFGALDVDPKSGFATLTMKA